MLIIEGVSCTGKTTLCNALSESHGFFVAAEGIRYIERFFGKPREEIMRIPVSIEEERYNQDLLFNAERMKLEEAITAMHDGRNVVLDKSALSIMSSAYAFEKVEGMFGDLGYACRKMADLIGDIGIEAFRHTKVALLDLDLKSREDRRLKRGTVLDDVWLDRSITSLQHSFLARLISDGLVEGRVFRSDDKDLLNQVLDFYGAQHAFSAVNLG